MRLEEIISRFQNFQRNGKGFMASCPTHEDAKNSLSLCEGDNGKILIKCMAGCSTKKVIDAAGLTWRDLSGVATDQNQSSTNDPVVARYVYKDEAGSSLFQVSRTRSKNFFQSRFDSESGKFIAGMNGTRRVLYRLPQLLDAEGVFVVEGEKDADKLTELGITATTSPGGAGKWHESYSACLKDKIVVILPDNDEPGENHAIGIAKSVLPIAKSVKIVSLSGLPPKGDVSDYLKIHSKEDLLALVQGAEAFTGIADRKGQANLWPEFLTAREILQAPKDPTRWIVSECLPAGGASVLVAKPKVGKSTIAADLAIAVARGEPWLGRATQQTAVAYVFLDGPLTDIADTFVQLNLRETDPVFIHAGSAPADAVAWILNVVQTKGVRLVIIDVLQKHCRFQNINDYSEVTTKMEPLLEAAREGNCHVMTLHHAKKDSHDDLDAAIGSTAIRGLAYTYLFAKRLANSERRILSSDQRGGKNFAELGIGFDKLTGRLYIQGTIENVEIEEASPLILKALEGDADQRESAIVNAIPMRAWIVGRALRALVKKGDVDRTGTGKKGNAYLYSLATTLVDRNETDHSDDRPMGHSDGLLRGIVKGETNSPPSFHSLENGTSGVESKKKAQPIGKTEKHSPPESREENGSSTEENLFSEGSGVAFDDAENELENDSEKGWAKVR